MKTYKHEHHQQAAEVTGKERKVKFPPSLVAALDEAVAFESPQVGQTR